MIEIDELIAEIKIESGLTIKDIADIIGVNKNIIYNWLNEEPDFKPNQIHIIKLRTILSTVQKIPFKITSNPILKSLKSLGLKIDKEKLRKELDEVKIK